MKYINPIIFAVVALLLFVYTFFYIDEHHHFLINAAWDSNLIEAKMVAYLMVGLGFCLAFFYTIFSPVLYTEKLVFVHVILYLLLAVNIVLWDNNIFSLQEIVESQGYNHISEVKGEYGEMLDRDEMYRVFFWVLLCTQTIGLVNLLLGFIKSDKN